VKAEASSKSPSSFLAPKCSQMNAISGLDGRDGKEFRHSAGDSIADGEDCQTEGRGSVSE